MYIAILCMAAGFILGCLIRKKRVFSTGTFMLVTISALLFVLGMELGRNRTLIASLGTLGLKSLAVAVLSVLGSIICAAILYRYAGVKKKDEVKPELSASDERRRSE